MVLDSVMEEAQARVIRFYVIPAEHGDHVDDELRKSRLS
jgi:hypothetical protein